MDKKTVKGIILFSYFQNFSYLCRLYHVEISENSIFFCCRNNDSFRVFQKKKHVVKSEFSQYAGVLQHLLERKRNL